MRLGAGDFALTLALRRALQLRHVDFLGPPERPSCKRRAPVVDHSPSPILGSERLIWPFGICRFGRTKPIFSIPFKELHFRRRKVSDEFTVPLCRLHHRELHRSRHEPLWWKKFGIDAIKIAAQLWDRTRSFRPSETGTPGRPTGQCICPCRTSTPRTGWAANSRRTAAMR